MILCSNGPCRGIVREAPEDLHIEVHGWLYERTEERRRGNRVYICIGRADLAVEHPPPPKRPGHARKAKAGYDGD